MEIIVYVTGFLLFFLMLLLMPVDLSFYIQKDETLDYRAEFQWLFGLVAVDMSRKESKPEQIAPRKKSKRRKPHFGSLLGGKGAVKRFSRLIRGLLQSVRIKELNLHCRVGLGDPAYTGMLVGLLHPLLIPGRHVTLQADFQEAVFEGYCKAEVRLHPIRVIGSLLVFLFSSVFVTLV